jgi:hypothetical protein
MYAANKGIRHVTIYRNMNGLKISGDVPKDSVTRKGWGRSRNPRHTAKTGRIILVGLIFIYFCRIERFWDPTMFPRSAIFYSKSVERNSANQCNSRTIPD